ncbi:MAG TPA: hypothetical protein VG318_09765 [Actinomycetota bacterium]|nr:hypothetical protein [Actinomycetota bacterium]
MAETITPVVHGGKRRAFVTSAALHVAGAALTAAALGLVLGGFGALLRAPWGGAGAAVVAAAAGVYFLREAFSLPIPLPQRRRQVPEWWRTFFSPPVAAVLYGAGLGVGFLTYLSFGTFAAVMAGAVASGDALTGAAVCAPFGLGRSIAVVVVAAAGHPVERLDELAGSGRLRAVNAAALLAVGVAAVL